MKILYLNAEKCVGDEFACELDDNLRSSMHKDILKHGYYYNDIFDWFVLEVYD